MRIAITLCFLAVLPVMGFSDTLVVPDDYPTIQEAIMLGPWDLPRHQERLAIWLASRTPLRGQ